MRGGHSLVLSVDVEMKGAGVVNQHAHTAVTRQVPAASVRPWCLSETTHGNRYSTVLAITQGNVKQNNITFFVMSVKNILI